jgi:glutamate--cysteine ligase
MTENQVPAPIESIDELEAIFHAGIKPECFRRVGTEHEKFVVRKSTPGVVAYEGPDGIRRLLEELMRRFGYDPILDRGQLIGLLRDGASVTLEPGGQFELSGAPFATLLETEAELELHFAEVREVCDELGLVCVGAGLNGLQGLDDVDWMPKSRYAIMRRYMERVGTLGHWMMKMTCTVQANYDFTSEQDAADMLRTALWLSPLVSAIFARSPIKERRPSGFMSYRCHIWTDTDPARTGFPRFMLDGGFGFRDYVDYTLSVPMYFIIRDKHYIDMAGHSFREFLENGHEGHRATMADYEDHISTLFPEVRMKRYIEVRGADVGPMSYVMGLPALWKGVLYNDAARSAARALVTDLSVEQRSQLFTNAIRWSLDGPFPGGDRQIREVALELLSIAQAGLPDNERRFLDPLIEDARADLDPAHRLLARWHELGGDTATWFLEQAYG